MVSMFAMVYDERNGTALHHLAYCKPEDLYLFLPELGNSKNRPKKVLKKARELCENGVDIFALDCLGKTAKEYAKFNNPQLFKYLNTRENALSVNALREKQLSYLGLLPPELVIELEHFRRWPEGIISIPYILKRFSEPAYFDQKNPKMIALIDHSRELLASKQFRSPECLGELGDQMNKLCKLYRAKCGLIPEILAAGISIEKVFRAARFNAAILEEICQLMQPNEKLQRMNIRDSFAAMDPPLYGAIFYMDLRLLKVCLEHGADPNVRNELGKTALHAAVSLHGLDHWPGKEEHDFCTEPIWLAMIKLICNAGADLQATDNEGDTPLMYAKKVLSEKYAEGRYVFPSGIKLLEDEMEKRSQNGMGISQKRKFDDSK